MQQPGRLTQRTPKSRSTVQIYWTVNGRNSRLASFYNSQFVIYTDHQVAWQHIKYSSANDHYTAHCSHPDKTWINQKWVSTDFILRQQPHHPGNFTHHNLMNYQPWNHHCIQAHQHKTQWGEMWHLPSTPSFQKGPRPAWQTSWSTLI